MTIFMGYPLSLLIGIFNITYLDLMLYDLFFIYFINFYSSI
ncbi:hypothetical protein yinte0001_31700 [Yersinia intermedia ATCC 29909]|nr:hypothetical protein yinte0001_31700 [Yersinia intermedia ATCC 29909]